MMRSIILVFLSLFIINPLCAQLKLAYYDDGAVKSEGMYKNDVADGPWKFYSQDGVLSSEGNKKNGKLQGTWKIYTKEGKLNSIGKYEKGIKSGEWKVYKKSGVLHSKGKYVNGLKEGFFIYYNEKNEEEVSGAYLKDKRTGEWVFNKERGITIKASYKNDALITKETITKGKVHSDFIKYNSKNKKLEEGKLVNGNKTGLWTFYYTNTGDKKYTVIYKDNKKNGPYIKYRHAGRTIARKGEYKDNKQVGKWIDYGISGLPSSELNYKNGLKHGRFINYYYLLYSERKKYGNAKKEIGQYKNGLKDGVWIKYYKNGDEKEQIKYVQGKLIVSKNEKNSSNKKSTKMPSDFSKGPSKNQAINYQVYMLTEHSFQLKTLKSYDAKVIVNKSIQIGPKDVMTYAKLKDNMDYLFYILTEDTSGKGFVEVNGEIQKNFYDATKKVSKNSDKCMHYRSKKKGASQARVSFGHSVYTKAQFILIEMPPVKK